MTGNALQHNILYSCYYKQKFGHEQLVEEHSLGILLSGELRLFSDEGTLIIKPGNIGLAKRSQLVKSLKIPGPSGEACKAINIIIPQELLRKYAAENNIEKQLPYKGKSFIDLSHDKFIKSFFDSLLPYFDEPNKLTDKFAILKTYEAIELLLQADSSLKNLLFDFQEPYKIDLEAFMNKNYNYNVPLKHFAKLTGRSPATFKRDFKKLFELTPEKWLQKKRLEKAHYLIAQKHRKPSDVYLEVGFENLSHFSTSFKKKYGYNASSLALQN
ncbi:MAG: AraC family transcriptional regulator [Arachidicoccus sp.]|nr:AraC family transcriptional regulator [Arachidicoccus sp.]